MAGAKPIAENKPRAQSNVSGSKPEKTSGSARGLRAAPLTAGGSGSPRKAPGTSARSGRRRAAATAARSRGAAPGSPVRRRAAAARGATLPAASIISPIGVMPAIGSLPNGNA
jgi:hypothetical protein